MATYRSFSRLLVVVLALVASTTRAKPAIFLSDAAAKPVALDRVSDLELLRCRAQVVDYRGRHALRLLPLAGEETRDTNMVAILARSDFKGGTIALDVAGSPRTDIAPG